MAFAGAGTLGTYTKAQLDAYVGNSITAYWNLLPTFVAIKAFFDAHSDGEFEATPGAGVYGPVGYDAVSHPINTLKGAVNEIAELGVIARGENSQTTIRGNSTAHDYRVTCRLVTPGNF